MGCADDEIDLCQPENGPVATTDNQQSPDDRDSQTGWLQIRPMEPQGLKLPAKFYGYSRGITRYQLRDLTSGLSQQEVVEMFNYPAVCKTASVSQSRMG